MKGSLFTHFAICFCDIEFFLIYIYRLYNQYYNAVNEIYLQGEVQFLTGGTVREQHLMATHEPV